MRGKGTIGGYNWSMSCAECGGDIAGDGSERIRVGSEGETVQYEWPEEPVEAISDGTRAECPFCGTEHLIKIEVLTEAQE